MLVCTEYVRSTERKQAGRWRRWCGGADVACSDKLRGECVSEETSWWLWSGTAVEAPSRFAESNRKKSVERLKLDRGGRGFDGLKLLEFDVEYLGDVNMKTIEIVLFT